MSQTDDKEDKGSAADPWAQPRSVISAQDDEGGPAGGSGSLAERVRTVLEEQINPALASHGGHIALVDVQEDRVFVRLSGGCQGCAGARMTLKAGVERVLREQIPEVKEVVDATDHAGGMDPFYSPGS